MRRHGKWGPPTAWAEISARKQSLKNLKIYSEQILGKHFHAESIESIEIGIGFVY